MPDKETVEAKANPASAFNELVAQKRLAGLTREQAENVARNQIERDKQAEKEAKKAAK